MADRVTSTTRILRSADDGHLLICATNTGEILAQVPLIDDHSRGGQYLGLLTEGTHLEPGDGVIAMPPPQRCRRMVNPNKHETSANPNYKSSSMASEQRRQDAFMAKLDARQREVETRLALLANVSANRAGEAERLAEAEARREAEDPPLTEENASEQP